MVAEMALDAVLRNLAVAGEAVRALPESTRELFPSTPWHSIAGLRNIVVHEYFRIDTETPWVPVAMWTERLRSKRNQSPISRPAASRSSHSAWSRLVARYTSMSIVCRTAISRASSAVAPLTIH